MGITGVGLWLHGPPLSPGWLLQKKARCSGAAAPALLLGQGLACFPSHRESCPTTGGCSPCQAVGPLSHARFPSPHGLQHVGNWGLAPNSLQGQVPGRSEEAPTPSSVLHWGRAPVLGRLCACSCPLPSPPCGAGSAPSRSMLCGTLSLPLCPPGCSSRGPCSLQPAAGKVNLPPSPALQLLPTGEPQA